MSRARKRRPKAAKNVFTVKSWSVDNAGMLAMDSEHYRPGYCESGVCVGKTFKGRAYFDILQSQRRIESDSDLRAWLRERHPHDEIVIEGGE